MKQNIVTCAYQIRKMDNNFFRTNEILMLVVRYDRDS